MKGYGSLLMAWMGCLIVPMAVAAEPAPGEQGCVIAAGKAKKATCPRRIYSCCNIWAPNLVRLYRRVCPPSPYTFTINWLPEEFHVLRYPCKSVDPLMLDINQYLPPDAATVPPPPGPPLPAFPEGYVAPLPGSLVPTPAPRRPASPITFVGPLVPIEGPPEAPPEPASPGPQGR